MYKIENGELESDFFIFEFLLTFYFERKGRLFKAGFDVKE